MARLSGSSSARLIFFSTLALTCSMSTFGALATQQITLLLGVPFLHELEVVLDDGLNLKPLKFRYAGVVVLTAVAAVVEEGPRNVIAALLTTLNVLDCGDVLSDRRQLLLVLYGYALPIKPQRFATLQFEQLLLVVRQIQLVALAVGLFDLPQVRQLVGIDVLPLSHHARA